jgi:hypothetical protein
MSSGGQFVMSLDRGVKVQLMSDGGSKYSTPRSLLDVPGHKM